MTALLGVGVAALVWRAGPSARAAGVARSSVTRYTEASSAPASTTTTRPQPQTAEDQLNSLPAGDRAVAYAKGPAVTVYPRPAVGIPSSTLANPNSLGAPLVFLVQSAVGNWLNVLLPQRPNGANGWIQASDVRLYSDDFDVVVHLASHVLDLYQSGRLIQTHDVVVGNAASPTPTGQFYVTELVASNDPNGAYGPYAFGLSDFSNTYTEFDGGPGQIAIHGTDEPWLVGTSASHGCVR
ncbi:MAG: L,D-transpeptidase, partial [Acidimicrobiales bacterium]